MKPHSQSRFQLKKSPLAPGCSCSLSINDDLNGKCFFPSMPTCLAGNAQLPGTPTHCNAQTNSAAKNRGVLELATLILRLLCSQVNPPRLTHSCRFPPIAEFGGFSSDRRAKKELDLEEQIGTGEEGKLLWYSILQHKLFPPLRCSKTKLFCLEMKRLLGPLWS